MSLRSEVPAPCERDRKGTNVYAGSWRHKIFPQNRGLAGHGNTLIACPKQPFPSTSPWIRSEGRKMRWVRETMRSDSERLISLRWEAGEPMELEHGDLSVLQLLLPHECRKSQQGRAPCTTGSPQAGQGPPSQHGLTPTSPLPSSPAGVDVGDASELCPYMTVLWHTALASPQGVRAGERRGLCRSERELLSSTDSRAMASWGSCSMVSWRRRLVSWISRSICKAQRRQAYVIKQQHPPQNPVAVHCPGSTGGGQLVGGGQVPHPVEHAGWGCR